MIMKRREAKILIFNRTYKISRIFIKHQKNKLIFPDNQLHNNNYNSLKIINSNNNNNNNNLIKCNISLHNLYNKYQFNSKLIRSQRKILMILLRVFQGKRNSSYKTM